MTSLTMYSDLMTTNFEHMSTFISKTLLIGNFQNERNQRMFLKVFVNGYKCPSGETLMRRTSVPSTSNRK